MQTNAPGAEPRWERRGTALCAAIPDAFWRDPAGYVAAHATWLKHSGHHRETGVFAVDGGRVLVKHCTLSSWRERLAYRLGRTALQREWSVLCFLDKTPGVAPQPLAIGWQRRERVWHGWLLMEHLPDTVTFDTLDPPREPLRSYRAARALAGVLAEMHAAGVCHGDLHSGNVLFDPHACTWRITDFSDARIGQATRAALVHDLVQLQHCLGKKVPLRVRLAFLTEYLAAFGRATGTSDELTGREWRWLWAEIRRKSALYSIQQAAERNKRCLHATRELAPVSEWLEPPLAGQRLHGWTVRTLSRRLVNDLVAAVLNDTWYLQDTVTLLRNTRDVVAGVWTHPQGRVMVTERREPRGRLLRLLARLRDGDPLTLWRASWRLHALHVGTPAPLLLLRLPGRTLIVHLYNDGHIAMQALLRAPALPPGWPPRAQLVRAVAAAVALLHDRGVAHGTLLPANIHLALESSGGVRVLFTGITAARFYMRLPWRRRVADLSRLYSASYDLTSAAARRAFLRAYVKALSTPCDVRQLILSVWEASQQ